MLETRLDQLERRVRRLTVALGIACLCAVGLLLMGSRTAPEPVGVVRAKAFELLDSTGAVVIGTWRHMPGGNALVLYGPGNRAQAARIQLLARAATPAFSDPAYASIHMETPDSVHVGMRVAGRDMASVSGAVGMRPSFTLETGTRARVSGKLLLFQGVPGPERIRTIARLPASSY